MQEAIYKQLISKPKLIKNSHFSYFQRKPLAEIHMDTMFYQPSGEIWVEEGKSSLIPVLVIVDVCTRYTMAFVQKRKNEDILLHLDTFVTKVKEVFKNNCAISGVCITDDAKELLFKTEVIGDYFLTHKLSTGINKAVFSEMAIKKIRYYLRKTELQVNLDSLKEETDYRIDRKNLQKILDVIMVGINMQAYIHDKEPEKVKTPTLAIGTPVFLINLQKFFPYQMKDQLRKKSYDYNFYTEPYLVSDIYGVGNVKKYRLVSAITYEYIKYWYYYDELLPINPEFYDEYLESYQKRF